MLEFPRWKYFVILLVLALSVVYALPNVFQSDYAVQVTANRGAVLDEALKTRVGGYLAEAGVQPKSVAVENESLLVRLADADAQTEANVQGAQRRRRRSWSASLSQSGNRAALLDGGKVEPGNSLLAQARPEA